MTRASAIRGAAAVALLVGGLVHTQLYFVGYRTFPDADPGRSFIANAAISGILAAVLVLRSEWQVRGAGIVVAVGT
jgi:hypothetical protein